MKSKRVLIHRLIFIIALVWTLFWAIVYVVSSKVEQLAFPKTIYTDISSLDFLEEYAIDGLSPSDSALKHLEPVESYTATVEYKNREYNVYAYVFSSIDEARAYYKNVTEISDLMRAKGLYYLYFKDNVYSKYCAYYENCVFKVEGEKFSRLCNFMEWFGKDLPIDISEEFYKEFGYYLPI